MRKSLFLSLLMALASSVVPSLPVPGEALAAPIFSGVSSPAEVPLVSRPPSASTAQTYSLRKAQNLGEFRVTFYWLVEEESYQGKKTNPLYTTDGKLVGKFTNQFIHDFQIESCALLSDGRIISYLKGRIAARVVDMPIGAEWLQSD